VSQPVATPVVAAPPERNVPDLVLTIVLLALTAALGAAVSVMGLFLVMASDSCGASSECDSNLIGLGVLFAVVAPWLCWIPALVVVIVRQVKHRLTWWVPVLAGVAYVPVVVGAFLVVNAGVRPIG
jgi:hypothetical protein